MWKQNEKQNIMTTLSNLKAAITTQAEFEIIAKEIWAMNFERLIKLKFSLEFATKKATDLTMQHLKLLSAAA